MGLSVPDLRRLFHGGNITIVMIKTYIISTKQLEEETVFSEALKTVSFERRRKIGRLRHEKDKQRSLAASIALDGALKEYGLRERDMEYDFGRQGKPCFRHYPALHFSISHAGGYAVCSIGPKENGNDIERIRSGKERVAKRFFTQEEISWIQEAPSLKEQEERIFRIWTMKESFLKVTGRGMSLPLQSFSFLIEDCGKIHLSQSFDQKRYFFKEYDITSVFKEEAAYTISVCSEDEQMAGELRRLYFEG